LFIVIAVQIGGFALLWSKDVLPPEYVYLPAMADKTAAASAAISPVVVVSPPDEEALRKIIQVVLEQELAPYSRSAVAMSPTGPIVKENSPENIQAYTEASTFLDSALASGRWTADMNFEMQAYSRNLTPEQHDRLLDKAGQAIMNKQITIEGNDFPIF
jgi:hypothetical protein